MQINLIAIGTRMPDWVNQALTLYQNRLPKDYQLKLIELPLSKRPKNADLKKIMQQEGEQLINVIPKASIPTALDRQGKTINTQQLADQLKYWHDQSDDLSILIGGPEGLTEDCLQKMQYRFSLSALTLPHPLVRVIIAEQLYRAVSIIQNHPYHR